MQRGRFCVTGAFRDLWITGNTRWLTAFLIVVAVQSVGVFAMDAAGMITLAPRDFAWLATIIGAFVFGFAIVLAGGCATGTYYRAGEGLVGSWFALIFYALFAAMSKTGVLAPAVDGLRRAVWIGAARREIQNDLYAEFDRRQEACTPRLNASPGIVSESSARTL